VAAESLLVKKGYSSNRGGVLHSFQEPTEDLIWLIPQMEGFCQMLAQLPCKCYVPSHKITTLQCKQLSHVFRVPWSWDCCCLYSAGSLTCCIV